MSAVKPYVPPVPAFAHPYPYHPAAYGYAGPNGYYGGYPGYAHHPGYAYGHPGELRDPYFYPPGYRHVSPVRSKKVYDPVTATYLEPKKWNNTSGYNTERNWDYFAKKQQQDY